jgi:hypothetical protein
MASRMAARGRVLRHRSTSVLALTSGVRHSARAASLGRSGRRADQPNRRDAVILEALVGDPRNWPGPNIAILVPIKSSSSKNSQVPDRMIIEEMLLSHLPSRRMSPAKWVWSPVKSVPSKAMIWGCSPARPSSPATTTGASHRSCIISTTMIFRSGFLLSQALTRASARRLVGPILHLAGSRGRLHGQAPKDIA